MSEEPPEKTHRPRFSDVELHTIIEEVTKREELLFATARCSDMEEPGSAGADGHDSQVQGDSKATTTTTTTYRTYKRRYAMVLAVGLINMCNYGMCFNLTAVSYKAADYFKATLPQINWFTQVYLIIGPFASILATYAYTKFTLKTGIHLGSALMCVGAATRALATSGLITAASTQYAVSMVGQVAAAIGASFTSTIMTKMAQSWFPDDERILATTIFFVAPLLGVSFGQVGSPLLVPETQKLPTLNYTYAGLAVLCELIAVVSVTRARPPTPPSRSAAQKVAAQRTPYLQQLRAILTCLPYLGLLCMHSIMSTAALFVGMLSQQILCSVGYTDLFSGVMMTESGFFGFVGSMVFAVGVRRTKALTPIVKLAFAISAVCGIALMELYLVPDQHALLLVAAALFGFFRNGMVPMVMEMSVETTYPLEETLSNALMSVTNRILGVVVTSLVVHFAGDLPDGLEDVEVCTDGLTSDLQAKDYSACLTGYMVVISLAVVLFVSFFHTPYKRRLVEEHTAHATTTPTP